MKLLGLDISKTSTGLAKWFDGTVITDNHTIDVKKGDENRFLNCYKDLRDYLILTCADDEYDVIIVEDIFLGRNGDTFRMLSVLNICIDILVDEGILKCKEYVKVQNGVWKSWLFKNSNDYTGMSDKVRIRSILSDMGFDFSSLKGSQDRYDALGMIIGYLSRDISAIKEKEDVKNKPKVRLSDLDVEYFLFEGQRSDFLRLKGVEESDCIHFYLARVTEKKLLELISSNVDGVFISQDSCNLGVLSEKLGLSSFVGGGYPVIKLKSNKIW